MKTFEKDHEDISHCETISFKTLKGEASERAKQQPLLQRIIKALSKRDNVFRELVVDDSPIERRVALLENGILQDFEFERYDDVNYVGAIFKGKIQNIEPGLKAMFVNIGHEKNAFLHYWDLLPAANDNSFEITRNNKSIPAKNISLQEIPSKYPIGSDVLVQITKGQIGTKGPRVTTNIALPGRYLVLMPINGECGISKKIDDAKERSRLRDILNKIKIPDGMGVIIRTAGAGKKVRYFVRDLHILLRRWQKIMNDYNANDKPCLLYEEPDLIDRTVRDFLTDDIDRVIVNETKTLARMSDIVEQISPRSKAKLYIFEESIPIFERFNIERQIEQTFRRRVPLSCGGEIVIHETEALTAIDVNTSNYKVSEKETKSYIFNLNCEAAKEIVRQLKLRNIGGLIVIDFIDMKSKGDRSKLYDVVCKELQNDKAKSHVLPLSQLGLMEISRQRHSQSNCSEMRYCCPYCNGDGFVKSDVTMCSEIYKNTVNYIKRLGEKRPVNGIRSIKISLNPDVLSQFKKKEKLLLDIEKQYNVQLSFIADTSYHIERYKIE